jgi:hypothetical protein
MSPVQEKSLLTDFKRVRPLCMILSVRLEPCDIRLHTSRVVCAEPTQRASTVAESISSAQFNRGRYKKGERQHAHLLESWRSIAEDEVVRFAHRQVRRDVLRLEV